MSVQWTDMTVHMIKWIQQIQRIQWMIKGRREKLPTSRLQFPLLPGYRASRDGEAPITSPSLMTEAPTQTRPEVPGNLEKCLSLLLSHTPAPLGTKSVMLPCDRCIDFGCLFLAVFLHSGELGSTTSDCWGAADRTSLSSNLWHLFSPWHWSHLVTWTSQRLCAMLLCRPGIAEPHRTPDVWHQVAQREGWKIF